MGRRRRLLHAHRPNHRPHSSGRVRRTTEAIADPAATVILEVCVAKAFPRRCRREHGPSAQRKLGHAPFACASGIGDGPSIACGLVSTYEDPEHTDPSGTELCCISAAGTLTRAAGSSEEGEEAAKHDTCAERSFQCRFCGSCRFYHDRQRPQLSEEEASHRQHHATPTRNLIIFHFHPHHQIRTPASTWTGPAPRTRSLNNREDQDQEGAYAYADPACRRGAHAPACCHARVGQGEGEEGGPARSWALFSACDQANEEGHRVPDPLALPGLRRCVHGAQRARCRFLVLSRNRRGRVQAPACARSRAWRL